MIKICDTYSTGVQVKMEIEPKTMSGRWDRKLGEAIASRTTDFFVSKDDKNIYYTAIVKGETSIEELKGIQAEAQTKFSKKLEEAIKGLDEFKFYKNLTEEAKNA